MVRECAKPWAEADADVCEAIDFLEYYARGAITLERGPELLQVPGERNAMRYAPRGVVAVISPWNFPLAIPTGMVAAGLAAGNAVVLKPAEQSPACALALVQALHGAGRSARRAGAAARVRRRRRRARARIPACTASRSRGRALWARHREGAAETPAGQHHVKRVVAEMGGKNCVIVDSDADLDEAVPAITASAFAYAGQKCSAAARVLVHEALHDALVERLAGAVEVLAVGQADDFATDVPAGDRRGGAGAGDAAMPPRPSQRAGVVARAGRAGLARAGSARPRWRAGSSPVRAVLREEVFGPLLTVEAVQSVEHACDVVDSLPFALTGGLFSRSPATVSAVARRSPVGNLYVNRGITGAMVGRQPFGGNRRSGVGSKAGGPDYLLQFVEPRVVTENTMRHGLVVE